MGRACVYHHCRLVGCRGDGCVGAVIGKAIVLIVASKATLANIRQIQALTIRAIKAAMAHTEG
ncbi:hypothetical protein EGU77_16625 [Pseudomonas syringae pv. theae]|nr:hypothetical protein [Pseudomonas syringae pv. theae]MBL3834625.1 hypothetical protein [Pseudomonas syringae pv. theae]MBL3868243.1 hypothetical protein [Pseudomonas syringae pv. theae]NAS95061.1 hypothetical protein [Pseudomonas syringae pv. actinidifoliorum]NAT64136.1 hypothetical protein [Pseudomonas syringae pv. actinidifoliorum]